MTAKRARAEAPADPQEVDIGILRDVVGFRIRRIQNHLSQNFAARVGRKDIKPGLFSTLAIISANPGISQTILAREIGFDKATVVALVDSLEGFGWAVRERAPNDRRRHALQITKEGKLALKNLLQVGLANEAKSRAALTPQELKRLFELLDKLYATCFAAEQL